MHSDSINVELLVHSDSINVELLVHSDSINVDLSVHCDRINVDLLEPSQTLKLVTCPYRHATLYILKEHFLV